MHNNGNNSSDETDINSGYEDSKGNTADNSTEDTLNTVESSALDNSATMQSLEEGSSIILENVLFDFDRSTLRPESHPTLDNIAEIMLLPPATAQAEISGHTDSKGPAEYNQQLSERRAKSVVNYLINKGIAKHRLISKGYGESRPAAPNANPDGSDNTNGRQLNRRTELRIIEQ